MEYDRHMSKMKNKFKIFKNIYYLFEIKLSIVKSYLHCPKS